MPSHTLERHVGLTRPKLLFSLVKATQVRKSETGLLLQALRVAVSFWRSTSVGAWSFLACSQSLLLTVRFCAQAQSFPLQAQKLQM